MDAEQTERHLTRIRRRRVSLLVAAMVLAALLLLVWWQRTPIADRFVQKQLAASDVRATYRIAQIAVRTQRIENLVLGDPARPDLVAKSVEVDLSYASIVPKVAAIRARGVRLFGSVDVKGLHLGELDKLRDTGSTAPFGMPDIDLTIEDGRMLLGTPAGPVGLSLSGEGNLKSGFAGKLAAVMRKASFGNCRMPGVSAFLDVHMEGGSPHFEGPVRSDALRCRGGPVATQLAVNTDIALSSTLDAWRGSLVGGASALRASGVTVAMPSVDMRFDGDAKAMKGAGTLRAAALGSGDLRASRSAIGVRWNWREGAAAAQGTVIARQVHGLDARGLRKAANSASETPVGPLLARLADSVGALQSDNRLNGRFTFEQGKDGGRLRLSSLALSGGRGARIALSNGSTLALSLPDAKWRLDGSLTSGGGGLPQMALRLRPAAGGGMAGQMFVKPYGAGGARLEMEDIRFAAQPGGATTISALLRLDGPLPDGEVRGFELPLVARWNGSDLIVNPDCAPVRFRSLQTGAMRLDASTLTLCPVDGALYAMRGGRSHGGAEIRQPRLAGHMGETPLGLSATSGRWLLSSGGFELADAEMRLGAGDAPVLLSAVQLVGGSTDTGIGGSASGISARIGTVPLLVREGDARWAYAGGVLGLDGRILILDDANPDRFNPVESRDFRLRLSDGRIVATGTLTLPGRDRRIAGVTVTHGLSDGAGVANFSVSNLRFDRELQPDEITHIALGVIANVRGSVNGSGTISWRGDRVKSSGDFTTEDLDFAAAFGPVDGFSTKIHFTDLLGLVSAPGQVIRMASVNPGVEVRDGIIHYALLSEQRVSIENGQWPFAGGTLSLLPTVMDMSSTQPRYMTFRVLGLDAGAFIQMMELENISATGTFDGLVPMVFDADGGRIHGGILTARQSGMPPLVIDHAGDIDIPCDRNRQGGNLAYVGQVSNENLGFMGKLAFDALKDLQYKCLTILMDGAIDGEIVTQVAFNGINRGELSTVPKPIASQFIGLPFIFNIKIEAPFRGLLNTARSFTDPSLLIRQHLGDNVTTVRENRLAVQPSESENMPSGERK